MEADYKIIYIDNLLEEVNTLIRLPLNSLYTKKMQDCDLAEFFDLNLYLGGKNYVKLLYITRIAMELSVEDPNNWKWAP